MKNEGKKKIIDRIGKDFSKPIIDFIDDLENYSIRDIIEIEVPSSSANQLILSGQLDYALDSLTVPDTFVLSDDTTQLYNQTINGGVSSDSIPFGALSGNLSIDVQESLNTSIWAVSIHVEFLQVTFKMPECQEDTPCYEFPGSKKTRKKKKPNKIDDCYEF